MRGIGGVLAKTNMPWRGRGVLENEEEQTRGEGESKLGNLERTYFLNAPLWVTLKTNAGVIFITALLDFHYFISLETGNTQKSEVF